ncbi:MAG: MiaB/RimO family radical SAM methylthiotransferase [Candidatus Bruticola sp.]
MATFSILTLGCRANQSDSERIGEILKSNGFVQVPANEPADLGIVNSCTVTAEADRKAGQMVRRLSKVCSLVMVTGCGAAAKGGLITKRMLNHNVIVLPPNKREQILEYIPVIDIKDKELCINNSIENNCINNKCDNFIETMQNSVMHRTRALLKVQEGCNHMCTFCIVPMVRGPLTSYQPEQLITQVHKLCSEGYKEIVLTGTHLALWGRDSSSKRKSREAGRPEQNFADLLEVLIKNSEGVRFRISSIEPMSFPERIIELMISYPERLCPHLHLVIQHASDKILAAMHRDYTLAQYDALAEKFLHQVPGACLTTDILVGFPGETEEDIDILTGYLQRRRFAHLHVFPYSRRQGTAAADFANQVDEQVKKDRVRKIIKLGEESAQNVYDSFIGTLRPVLAERPSARPGFLLGTADNFLNVEFSGNISDIGKIMTVEIRRTNEL